MLATALSTMLVGLDAHLVRVEVEALRGVPSFVTVGLAQAAVRESRVRVRSALGGVGIDLGEWNIVVNMAPADVRKVGSAYDVAIAAATCGAVGEVPAEALKGLLVLGELSLGGSIEPVRGVLAQLVGARARGVTRAVVPRANAGEASLVDGVEVTSAGTLGELLASLRGELSLGRARASPRREVAHMDDLADVRGQGAARRALEIAAAGGHHLLLMGPAGAGKTMLARRLPGVLPPLTSEEGLEVAAIHSLAGTLREGAAHARPFRAPHHTASEAALVGGGELVRPGEVSLAHHGVLFLDELAEFRRATLEALRQPIEDGFVAISRAQDKVVFPSRPTLVAATNPCPCARARCVCTKDKIAAYRARMSGALLDRLDLHVVVMAVDIGMLQEGPGEPTAAVRLRVLAARAIQQERRARGEVDAWTNARLSPAEVRKVVALDADNARLVRVAAEARHFSARAYHKVLRVSRTIADLAGSEEVRKDHLAEAILLRAFDRNVEACAA